MSASLKTVSFGEKLCHETPALPANRSAVYVDRIRVIDGVKGCIGILESRVGSHWWHACEKVVREYGLAKDQYPSLFQAKRAIKRAVRRMNRA